MTNILLLTKSLMSEQVLEQQFQQLDYEVYVSRRVLENGLYEEVDLNLLSKFELILISETVSNSELNSLLPAIKEAGTLIIRKTDSVLSEEEKNEWKTKGVVGWVKTQNTLEELRELIDEVVSQNNTKKRTTNIISIQKVNAKKNFSTLILTHKERKLLTLLIQAKGTTISREQLSHKLWNQAPCNSTMTQLSTLIHRLKFKLAEQGIYGDIVQTVWGVGYKLLDDFYEQVNPDEVYLNEM